METMMHYPDYLLDYSCKCGKCRHTCCSTRDWDISIHHDEYEAIVRKMTEDPGLATFGAFLVAPEDDVEKGAAVAGAREDAAATVRAREDGLCTMLGPDGTCTWRLREGSDLCSICREFPIMYLKVFDDVYTYPSGACEAVLETLMHRNTPVTLRVRPLAQDEATSGTATCEPDDVSDECNDGDSAGKKIVDARGHSYELNTTEQDASRDSIYGVYGAFVKAGIDILQNPVYTLDQRMAILLSCMNVVDRALQVGQKGAQLIPLMQSMLDKSRIAAILGSFEHAGGVGDAGHADKADGLLLRACGEMYLSCLQSEAYAPMAKRVLDGMGLRAVGEGIGSKSTLKMACPERFGQRRERYRDYMLQEDGFLAKVMVGVYLHGMLPIAQPGVWQSTKYFALCYALVKCGIMGYFEETPTDDELIDFLVILLRAFTHNGKLYQNALRWMDQAGLDDLRDVVDLVL